MNDINNTKEIKKTEKVIAEESMKHTEDNNDISKNPSSATNDIEENENLNKEIISEISTGLKEDSLNPENLGDASLNEVISIDKSQVASKLATPAELSTVEANEENTLGNSIPNQEVIYSKNSENSLAKESKPLNSFFSFLLLFIFLAIMLFPMLTAQRALFPIEAEYNSVLAYMQESGQYLVPAFGEGLYSKVYVLPMLLLAGLSYVQSMLALDAFSFPVNIYFISLAISFILFIFSTLCLAVTFKSTKKEFIAALCINYGTIIVLAFAQLVQFDFLFAALVNFSLLFFFKAWLKQSAFISLFFAFIFMALALFTNGSLAFFLPLAIGIFFTFFRLDIKRLFKNDALVPFTLFFVLLGSYYMYLYYHEDGAYAMLLYKNSFLNHSLTSWFNLKKEYFFLLLLLFPFLFIPFFANYKESLLKNIFKTRKKYHLITAKTMHSIKNSLLTEEELQELAIASSLAIHEKNAENIPLQNSTTDEKNTEAKLLSKLQLEKMLYKASIKASSSLFMLLVIVIFFILSFALPNSTFGQVLVVIPLFSIFMARIFTHTSSSLQRYFFIFIAIFFLLLAALFVTIFMLPQVQNIYPQIISIIPTALLEVLTKVPHLSMLALFFTSLALFLFVFSRVHPQKLLFLLVFVLLLVMLFAHYFLLPRLGMYLYAL